MLASVLNKMSGEGSQAWAGAWDQSGQKIIVVKSGCLGWYDPQNKGEEVSSSGFFPKQRIYSQLCRGILKVGHIYSYSYFVVTL